MARPGGGRWGSMGDVKEFDPYLFRRLVTYLVPYRRQVYTSMVLIVIVSLSQLAGPYLIGFSIDAYIRPTGDLGQAERLHGLLIMGLLYAAAQVAFWLSAYYRTYYASWAGQRAIFDLRQALFDHLQTLDFDFFDSRPAGVIMSRVTNDVTTLNQMLSEGLVNVLGHLLTVLVMMGIMVWLHPRLALVAFIVIPALIWVAFVFRERIRNAFRKCRESIARIAANLQESISGIRVTASFAREERNIDEFREINEENYAVNMEARILGAIYMPVVEIVGAVGTALVLWYGGSEIIALPTDETAAEVREGLIGGGITLGLLVMFMGYLNMFFTPLREMSNFYNEVQAAMASCEKIFGIIDTEPGIVDRAGAYDLPRVEGRVVFDRVRFRYVEDEPVLDEFSCTAEPGQRIALVGHTGAGKTTVTNLLARFYEPQSGCIAIDGHDIGRVTQASLRRQLGIVLQDTLLFSGTVADNIRYGRPEADDEAVRRAARAVSADIFIDALPGGYETRVEERGQNFSMGQRQLISFARVVLRDPRILILDEATASIDAYTELLIQAALEELLAGRTSFVIAHRLSTIRSADCILVMERGRIVEQGSHDELLAAQGAYRDLYELQFKAQEVG